MDGVHQCGGHDGYVVVPVMSDAGLCAGNALVPAPFTVSGSIASVYQVGFGQSFATDASTTRAVMSLAPANVPVTTVIASATSVGLYVDPSTGTLKLSVGGVPLVSVFVWLDATAPFVNV